MPGHREVDSLISLILNELENLGLGRPHGSLTF